MKKLSQNKKIGISVVFVFMLSFTTMVMYLGAKTETSPKAAQTSVIGASESAKEISYVDIVRDSYLENSVVPTFMMNPEGRINYANRAFCKLLGRNCNEVESNLFYDFVNTKDLSQMVSVNSSIFYRGEEVDNVGPYRLIGVDGEELFVMSDVRPIVNDEGEVSHILFSLRDLTDQVNEIRDEVREEKKNKTFDPKIKTLPDEGSDRLMADRISYNADNQ